MILFLGCKTQTDLKHRCRHIITYHANVLLNATLLYYAILLLGTTYRPMRHSCPRYIICLLVTAWNYNQIYITIRTTIIHLQGGVAGSGRPGSSGKPGRQGATFPSQYVQVLYTNQPTTTRLPRARRAPDLLERRKPEQPIPGNSLICS